jgi:CheY-like chemotaxis protein
LSRRGHFARSRPVKRILVIDDDTKLRTQCAELLRLEGYEVFEARNGREGVERARREVPDLGLCDITMPEMNGHRVLETLRLGVEHRTTAAAIALERMR